MTSLHCAMLAAASRVCLGARVRAFAKGVTSHRTSRDSPRRGFYPSKRGVSTTIMSSAKFGKSGERVYPEEGKVEVAGAVYRRCAAALVFNKNGDVLLGERLDRPGSWGMPQGGVEVRLDAKPKHKSIIIHFFPSHPFVGSSSAPPVT